MLITVPVDNGHLSRRCYSGSDTASASMPRPTIGEQLDGDTDNDGQQQDQGEGDNRGNQGKLTCRLYGG